jgi:hypothetical protein
VLDALPLRSVLAIYQDTGRIRRQRLHDAFLVAGQTEAAAAMRDVKGT